MLRSEDGGHLWQHCAVPPGAEKLDFRGIQAFDANTAIVMSSGKGDLSRLYKTTDGCQTWTFLFTNPDKDGFWDGILASTFELDGRRSISAQVIGDPVDGHFILFRLTSPTKFQLANVSPLYVPDFYCDKPYYDRGSLELPPVSCDKHTGQPLPDTPIPRPGESLFAASNSAFLDGIAFVTGGASGARFVSQYLYMYPGGDTGEVRWITADLPLTKAESGGAFSIAARSQYWEALVVIGGDYLKPNESNGTAAFSTDRGKTWTASTTPPHGYRSAVAYDEATKTWITVGPNGTDISTDDGRNWRALKPGPSDPADADQHWNALSLPFVVGPHGRIGVLNPAALKSAAK